VLPYDFKYIHLIYKRPNLFNIRLNKSTDLKCTFNMLSALLFHEEYVFLDEKGMVQGKIVHFFLQPEQALNTSICFLLVI